MQNNPLLKTGEFYNFEKNNPMKTKIISVLAVIFIAAGFTSCEMLNDCKTCRQVTYVDNLWDHDTDPAEYCGASLLAIEAMADYVDGNTRTTWECN